MSIAFIITKIIVGVEGKQEAIEGLNVRLFKSSPEPSSEQVVLFIKNTSLAVNIWNSLFKNVLV